MGRAERVLKLLLEMREPEMAREELLKRFFPGRSMPRSPESVAATVCDIFELRSIQGESVEVTARRIRRLIDPEEDT